MPVLQFGGGLMGPPGPPGVCSCNLTTLVNSLSLQDATPGPPGLPGIDGKAGPPGTSVNLTYNQSSKDSSNLLFKSYVKENLSDNDIYIYIQCI